MTSRASFGGVRFAATPTGLEHAKPYVPDRRLFMSIWTPYLAPSPPVNLDDMPQLRLKPVMFYIHGGGLTWGS